MSDTGQIVMACSLGQSISKTTGLVGCFFYAEVSTYLKIFERTTSEPVGAPWPHKQY